MNCASVELKSSSARPSADTRVYTAHSRGVEAADGTVDVDTLQSSQTGVESDSATAEGSRCCQIE
jgi:hypothetical protein